MSENEETELIQEVEEAHNSDGESVDSEGYSKHDPYAAEAKRLDRQKAAQEAFENSALNKAANKLLENKENISFFEKHLKTCIVFAMLCCMCAANIDELFKERPASDNGFKLTDLFNIHILIDMKRELIMLFGSWGLYFGMRRYNEYLDRLEEEQAEL